MSNDTAHLHDTRRFAMCDGENMNTPEHEAHQSLLKLQQRTRQRANSLRSDLLVN